MILVVFIGLGFLAGWLQGGRLSNLSRLKLRGEWVALVALVAQSLLRGPLANGIPPAQRVLLWVAATAVAFCVCLANYRCFGMSVIALGLLLNMVVVLANWGMPVSAESLSLVSPQSASEAGALSAGFYHAATPETRMLLLADILPLPGPRSFRAVFSLGDAALWAGVAIVIASGMRNQCPEAE